LAQVHRDIKGGNILVEKSGRIKLADFGMAKQMVEKMSLTRSFKGSAFWMAPEVRAEASPFPLSVSSPPPLPRPSCVSSHAFIVSRMHTRLLRRVNLYAHSRGEFLLPASTAKTLVCNG